MSILILIAHLKIWRNIILIAMKITEAIFGKIVKEKVLVTFQKLQVGGILNVLLESKV